MNTFDFVVVTKHIDEILLKVIETARDSAESSWYGIEVSTVDQVRAEYAEYINQIPNNQDQDVRYLLFAEETLHRLLFILPAMREEAKKGHLA